MFSRWLKHWSRWVKLWSWWLKLWSGCVKRWLRWVKLWSRWERRTKAGEAGVPVGIYRWNTLCWHQLSGWILFLHFFTMGEYYSAFAIFCNRQNTFTTGEILFVDINYLGEYYSAFFAIVLQQVKYFFLQVKYFLLTLTIWVNAILHFFTFFCNR